MKKIPVLAILIGIDLSLMFLYLIWGNLYLFNLDAEGNLPTYYQSLKLLVVGGIVFYGLTLRLFSTYVTRYWLPLGLGFLFVGLDELLQIHENIYRVFLLFPQFHEWFVDVFEDNGFRSTRWLIYYSPLLLLGIIWCFYTMFTMYHGDKQLFRILLVGLVMVGVVFVIEMIATSGVFSQDVYRNWVMVEEGVEMIGVSLLGWMILGKFDSQRNS